MPRRDIEVATLKHREAKRRNIPTAELEPVMAEEDKSPLRIAYERRNRDLDPQLVWRGKDEQDWSDLIVPAPSLYIQEKVHPKVLIDDLIRQSKERAAQQPLEMPDLFADFNGLPDKEAVTEFYRHDANWSNRMILGDSLAVMACDDDIIPLQERIENVADEADLEEAYNTERHLLYVACTRARDHLVVAGVEPESEFLGDLCGADPQWAGRPAP